MENLPHAYNGELPFIFVSYAHKNSDYVVSVIRRLMLDGYRVWYDEGITPGSTWDEKIAAKLNQSACFIAFISEAFIDSDNCKEELALARKKEKNYLLVHLDDTPMSIGMRMRYGKQQAVLKKNTSEDDLIEKIEKWACAADTKGEKHI